LLLPAAGDKEAALGVPVSSICDRRRASVPQSQLTFVEYVAKPCFRWAWHAHVACYGCCGLLFLLSSSHLCRVCRQALL
jgi:hypothetical protein